MHIKRYPKYKPDTICIERLNGNDSLYDPRTLFLVSLGKEFTLLYEDNYQDESNILIHIK